MPVVTAVTRDGTRSQIDVTVGHTLMEALRSGGIDELEAMCGGGCSCGTCHVYLTAEHLAALPSIGPDEEDMLEGSSHREPNSRLSCQVVVSDALDGMVVTVAPEE